MKYVFQSTTTQELLIFEVSVSKNPINRLKSGHFRSRSLSSVVVVSNNSNSQGSSRHKRAGTYVLILLLVFTISWTPFILLLIHDFKVKQ